MTHRAALQKIADLDEHAETSNTKFTNQAEPVYINSQNISALVSYASWLYDGYFDLVNPETEVRELCAAWILGDKIGAMVFQNEVMEVLFNVVAEPSQESLAAAAEASAATAGNGHVNGEPSSWRGGRGRYGALRKKPNNKKLRPEHPVLPGDVAYVYDNTPQASKLRKLMANLVIEGRAEFEDKALRKSWEELAKAGGDLAVDIFNRVLVGRAKTALSMDVRKYFVE